MKIDSHETTNRKYHAVVLGGILRDYAGRPLGPYRLRSACKRKGFEIKVIDFAWQLTSDRLLNILSAYITKETLVLGISNVWLSTSKEVNDKESLVNRWIVPSFWKQFKIRFPWCKIVIGGTKPTLVQGAELLKPYAEWWLTGFSDIAFPKLLQHLQGNNPDLVYRTDADSTKIIQSDTHYKVSDMDELETFYEAEDRFKDFQPLPLEVSRGCIFKCAFCSHPFLGKKSYDYIRSPESLARELKRNYNLFGTTRYFITDDTFNDSIEKLDRLERAIDLSGIPDFNFVCYIRAELIASTPAMIPILKRLGCKGGTVGIESMNNYARRIIGKGMDIERVLDSLAKFKAETGVRLHTGMIVGLPGDQAEDAIKWHERFIADDIFSDWTFQQLGLIFTDEGEGLSLFEKNPGKFGYSLSVPKNDLTNQPRSRGWINDVGATEKECKVAAEEISKLSEFTCKVGGFGVGDAWYHGVTDKEILTLPKNQLRLGRRGIESGIIRAKESELEARKITTRQVKK